MGMRLLCVLRLDTMKNSNPAAKLREKKKTIGAIMTEKDFEVLNRRLHTVRKKN